MVLFVNIVLGMASKKTLNNVLNIAKLVRRANVVARSTENCLSRTAKETLGMKLLVT